MTESLDVTDMVLVFENISFSSSNVRKEDIEGAMDITDIQNARNTDPGISGFFDIDTDSIELKEVAPDAISPNHNFEQLRNKQAELSNLLQIIESLIQERNAIKQLKHKSSSQANRVSEITREVNRLKARRKSFEKTINRLNQVITGSNK
mgnify:CR=1 FL=1